MKLFYEKSIKSNTGADIFNGRRVMKYLLLLFYIIYGLISIKSSANAQVSLSKIFFGSALC